MHPDLILPKSAQNYNKSINHKFEFTKIKPIYHCSFICSLVIHIGKKKLKKYFFECLYLLFVLLFWESSCFSWQWGAQNHKGRLSEPTINFTTLQTSVVYIYSILTTNPPSFFDFFDFFRVLHHGKDHSFHSIARRAAVGRRKIVLCIAYFTKR